jgi:hypothetical protein
MKKISLAIIFCLLIFNLLIAQDIFNIKIDGEVYLRSISQTKDSGYIVAGTTRVAGGRVNQYVAKIDKDQNLLWTKMMGNSSDSEVADLVISGDNGFVVAGTIEDSGNAYIGIIKIDNAGNIIWYKTMGSGAHGIDCFAESIANTNDGGYIITGSAVVQDRGYLDVYILKLDSAGNAQWAKTTGGSIGSDVGRQVIQCSDGGYAVAGYTHAFNEDGLRNVKMYVMKLDRRGNFEWKKLIGQNYMDTEYTNMAFSILQTQDGGFIVAGVDAVVNVDAYLKIVKLDSGGELVWAKVASWLATDGYPNFVNVIESNSGGYFFTGAFLDSVFRYQKYIFELTPEGDFKFAKAFETSTYDGFTSVCKTFDKGYALVNTNGEIMKLDSNLSSCSPYYDARQGTFYTAHVTTPASIDLNWRVVTSNVKLNISSGGGNLIKTCSTLPLHLISFIASRNGPSNILHWNTANEINTNYFEIQRSNDGRKFSALGRVRARNQTKNEYSYTDAYPSEGMNYYRLLLSDKDAGSNTYSEIRSVNNSKVFDVSISPNPVKETLTLKFNCAQAITANIEIANAEGRIVFSTKMHVKQGLSFQHLNVLLKSKGYYFLNCIAGNKQARLKFVKE